MTDLAFCCQICICYYDDLTQNDIPSFIPTASAFPSGEYPKHLPGFPRFRTCIILFSDKSHTLNVPSSPTVAEMSSEGCWASPQTSPSPCPLKKGKKFQTTHLTFQTKISREGKPKTKGLFFWASSENGRVDRR